MTDMEGVKVTVTNPHEHSHCVVTVRLKMRFETDFKLVQGLKNKINYWCSNQTLKFKLKPGESITFESSAYEAEVEYNHLQLIEVQDDV